MTQQAFISDIPYQMHPSPTATLWVILIFMLFVATTMFIIFWAILINEQIFFLLQVKRSVIVSNKHGIYELPHECPNDLKLRKSGKSSKFIWLSAQSSSQNENFVSISKKLLKKKKLNFSGSALFHIKTRVCLKFFVNDCLCKQLFASSLPQTPSNLICLTIFVTLRPLTQFQPKIRATNMQKSAKICLTR